MNRAKLLEREIKDLEREIKERDKFGLRDTAPTLERELHGGIVGAVSIDTESRGAAPGTRMHRTQPPVERYASRGQITPRQAMAADDIRSDWEFGIIGVRAGERVVSGGGPISLTDAQLDAATAYRLAVQAMGPRVSAIVLPIVIGDAAGGEITVDTLAARQNAGEAHLGEITAGQLASRLRQHEKRIMGVLAIGLEILADHYSQGENRSRASRYG